MKDMGVARRKHSVASRANDAYMDSKFYRENRRYMQSWLDHRQASAARGLTFAMFVADEKRKESREKVPVVFALVCFPVVFALACLCVYLMFSTR